MTRRIGICAFVLFSICSRGGSARADESLDEDHGEGRLLLAPRIGAGMGAIGGHLAPFPHFIGMTELGAEIAYEKVPWGVWGQGTFLSSGADGQWNAPSFAAGASWRVVGDGVNVSSLVLRGGIAYERWHAASNACTVYLFVPTSCRTFPARDPNSATGYAAGQNPVDDNGDNFGLLLGARLELPLSKAYFALDASFVPTVDVSAPAPGSSFTFRLAVLFGFRDRKVHKDDGTDDLTAPDNRHRMK